MSVESQVRDWLRLTHVTAPLYLSNYIDEYRVLKGSGNNASQIIRIWESRGLHFTIGGTVGVTRSQAGAIVTAMEQIEKGVPIQDPSERPSWSESYDMGLGKLQDKIPWGKIILAGLAYAFVTQGLPNLLRK